MKRPLDILMIVLTAPFWLLLLLTVGAAVRLGLAVGGSIVTAIVVSTALGAVIPLFFKALKIDPALASGPVVTSTNDVVSLVIYLCMGTAILGW